MMKSREVEVDKLELRLGPPSKEEEDEDEGGEQQSRHHHQQLHGKQQAVKFAVPLPPPSFGHIRPSSNGNYLSASGKNCNGFEFRKPYSSVAVPGTAAQHHQNQATNGSSQKRVAPSSAIGWPPIRSFRKKVITAANHTYINNKPPPSNSDDYHSHHHQHNNSTEHEQGNHRDDHHHHQIKKDHQVMMMKTTTTTNDNDIMKTSAAAAAAADSLYVKIYMDGFPIGRKVNLKAHDNYQSLSSAVDQLFRGILPPGYTAWNPTSGSDNEIDHGKKLGGSGAEKEIAAGLLDGNGEYTLVYEDNEGDRVLVGDVPWNMFLSTAKRLRVLKSSELRATSASQPT